ncbi:unnamed protein product, partial [Prorocentrum cordatum]
VQNRAIAFFTCFLVLLLASLMINRTFQTKPTRLRAAQRWGFIVEGLVCEHPLLLGWGCYYFSNWVLQKAFSEFADSMIVGRGVVFWIHLLADNVFNVWALVFLVKQMSHCASSSEGTVGATSDMVPSGAQYHEGDLTKKGLLLCQGGGQRAFQAVLILFGTVSVWTLLNE